MMPIEFHTGLIWEDRENTPEQQMALDELYRSLDRSIPASYDNRAKGIPDCKIAIHNLMTHERYRFLKIPCMYIPKDSLYGAILLNISSKSLKISEIAILLTQDSCKIS